MRFAVPLALLFTIPSVSQADPPEGSVRFKVGPMIVHFPGKPKENTQSVKTDLGTLKITTASFAHADGNIVIASITEFPAEAVKPDNRGTLFDGVVKGLAGKDGKVQSEKEITIGKEKGREVVIEKAKVLSRYRMVVKDTFLIQLGALGTREYITGKDADAFFDSFEITK